MEKLKRIVVILLAVLLITSNVSGIAFASEAVQPVQGNNTYEADSNSTEPADTDASAQVTALSDTATDEASDIPAEVSSEEGALPPVEGYEVYVDEQGQVFYVEKEPEEPVIIDTQEEESTIEPESTSEQEPVKKETVAVTKPSYSEKELRLLASLIYAEAGNQSYKGMLAVANVVLNRVKSPVYAHCDTIKAVIYDKKWSVQFAVTVKSKKTGLSMLDKALAGYDTGKFSGANPEAEQKAMKKAIKAAKAALSGENNIGSYLCFNAVSKSTSRIKKQYPDYKIIGDHIFYRTK